MCSGALKCALYVNVCMSRAVIMSDVESQIANLLKGADTVYGEGELLDKLKSGQKLRVKCGFDPTAPDLHWGHTVLLNTLATFQKYGHEVCFLIGDFTGMIGDPTGKSATRKPLTREQVQENAKTYAEQVFKILDKDRTRVVFNSEWMDSMTAAELIRLAASTTVARMMERDDFNQRFKSEQPIAIHEFLYPLMQGYDSYALEADVEIGGTDQTFNMLMGRTLQKHYGASQQAVITFPLLEGLDGVNKMSKSLNNYIGVDEKPGSMFQKVLSIPDHMIWRYFELLSQRPMGEIAGLRKQVDEGMNPRDVKIEFAREMIERFHSKEDADNAHLSAGNRLDDDFIPDDLEETLLAFESPDGVVPVSAALNRAGLCKNSKAARDALSAGSVKVDGEVASKDTKLAIGQSYILRVGKSSIAKVILGYQ